MDDFIGKSIKGYDIQHVIGQGGMATVYLARQQSMNRNVALKVLPKQFMTDDTYLQRFEREVAIVSRLEHRNVLPVYDYGEHEGQPYIVMRYMPAGSVDDLLQEHGAMDNETMLNIITQIAPALDYAHTKDVLHRDLKPSNVLMDEDGGAFLTDFGIARLNNSPGMTITTQGVVGTPSYMSPEQARGETLDGRSDIYALGVMLFEMATGRRPFESDTPYSIAVMQVTAQPPQPRTINAQITMAVESVILKALRKNPEERYQTAKALAEALKLAIERPDSLYDTEPNLKPFLEVTQSNPVTPPQAYMPPQPAQTPPPVAAPRPPQQPLSQQPQPTPQSIVDVHPVAKSYKRKSRSVSPLWGVFFGGALGCGLLVIIAAVGFFVVAPMLGIGGDSVTRTPNTITPRSAITGEAAPTLDLTSESARQTLIARSTARNSTPAAVDSDADNGITGETNATPVTTRIPTSGTAAPSLTPLLDVAPIGVRGTPTLESALRAATGTIIYTDQRGEGEDRTFEIVKVHLSTWAETQLTQDGSDNYHPVVSPDGQWVAFQSDRDGDFEIYIVNPVGSNLRQVTRNTVVDRFPAWSPDGEWLIYASDDGGDGLFDLYRIRPDGTDNERILSTQSRISHPRYSPDGRYIVFTTGDDPTDARSWEIALFDTQLGEVTMLTDNFTRDASPSFSVDGTQIIYTTFNGADNDIAIMNIDGSNQRVLYHSEGNDFAPTFSPDGQFIAFASDVGEVDQIYIMTVDGQVVQQITSTGGAYPVWIR